MVGKYKKVIALSIADIRGINPSFCTYKIILEDDTAANIQPQRRLNLTIKDVVKNEVFKLLNVGIIGPISNNEWVSLV